MANITSSKLASMIAKIEGKRSQARVGDIREIIKIIQTMIKEEVMVCETTRELPVTDCLNAKAETWKQKQLRGKNVK